MQKSKLLFILFFTLTSLQYQFLYAPQRGAGEGTPVGQASPQPQTTPGASDTEIHGTTSGIEHVTNFITGKTFVVDLKWKNKVPTDSSYGPSYTDDYIKQKNSDISKSTDENTFLANACALWRILQIKGISDSGVFKTVNDTYRAVRQVALSARPYGENGKTAVKKILEVVSTDRQNNCALGTGKPLESPVNDDESYILRGMYLDWDIGIKDEKLFVDYDFGNIGKVKVITWYKAKDISSNPKTILKTLNDKLWPETFIRSCATVHYLLKEKAVFSTSTAGIGGTAQPYLDFMDSANVLLNNDELKQYIPTNGKEALKEIILAFNKTLMDYGTSKVYSSSQTKRIDGYRTTYEATGVTA